MALVQTDTGDAFVLFAVKDVLNGSGFLHVHLFKNDFHPITTSIVSDYTECDYPGYAAQTVTGWSGPDAIIPIPWIYAPPLTYALTSDAISPQSAYGYWVERDDDIGAIWWAERFSAPVAMTLLGDGLVLYLLYTNDSFFHGP